MADLTVYESIQIKRALANTWVTKNPVLLDGELGWEKDTNKLKIGTGTTAWNDLIYFGSAGTAVSSEDVQDIVAALIIPGAGISKVYNDNNNTLTISLADEIFTSTLKTKLDGIATGAQVNRTGAETVSIIDAALGNTLWKSQLSDEQVQDIVGAMVTGNVETNIIVTYDDNTGKLNFESLGGGGGGLDQEQVEDIVENLLITSTGLQKVYNDALGTLTISLTGASYTTGEQSKLAGIETNATADQTDLEIKTAYETNADTNAFTDAEKSKLAGIASGATVNSADATLLARANHTGTQLASTISDFATAVGNSTAVVLNTAKRTYPSGDQSKLAGIEDGATADQVLSDFGITVTSTVINYLTGVTSNVQTQLNAKGTFVNSTSNGITGTQNGTNRLFTVGQNAYKANSLLVFVSGFPLSKGNGLVETSPGAGTFTLDQAPTSSDILIVQYSN